MRHSLRTSLPLFSVGLLLWVSEADASRLAVIAMSSAHGQEPVEIADALTSSLLAQRHRTIASADAKERLLSGNTGAGADWAAAIIAVVRRGREALTRLERHAAEQARREASESIERAGGGAAGPDALVEWALLESALAASAGDQALAKRWLTHAATLGPNVVLDPLLHPEPERGAFESAVENVRRQPGGTLDIVTVPPGAELWVDGTRRCRTSCTTGLPPGNHFVRITSPAHAPATFTFDLLGGQTLSRRVGLTSAYTGAPLTAIRAMLDNPSRLPEAHSSLANVADFLDVDHVLLLRRGKNNTLTLRVAPAVPGNDAFRGGLQESAVASSALAMLRKPPKPIAAPEDDGAWYESSALWIGAASIAVVAAGATLLLTGDDETRHPTQGTLVIGGP